MSAYLARVEAMLSRSQSIRTEEEALELSRCIVIAWAIGFVCTVIACW